MIIEQVIIDAPKNLFLVHYDLLKDKPGAIKEVSSWLATVPGYKVLMVPGGHPAPSNPLPKIIIFNADNAHLMSAVEKIAKNTAPGAIIPLTKEEMDAWVNSKATDWVQI